MWLGESSPTVKTRALYLVGWPNYDDLGPLRLSVIIWPKTDDKKMKKIDDGILTMKKMMRIDDKYDELAR